MSRLPAASLLVLLLAGPAAIAADAPEKLFDRSETPVADFDFMLLMEAGCRFEADGRLFERGARNPVRAADFFYVLEGARSRARLQALMQINLVFSRNSYAESLPAADRELVRGVGGKFWPLLPEGTRKRLSLYFGGAELARLERLRRELAPLKEPPLQAPVPLARLPDAVPIPVDEPLGTLAGPLMPLESALPAPQPAAPRRTPVPPPTPPAPPPAPAPAELAPAEPAPAPSATPPAAAPAARRIQLSPLRMPPPAGPPTPFAARSGEPASDGRFVSLPYDPAERAAEQTEAAALRQAARAALSGPKPASRPATAPEPARERSDDPATIDAQLAKLRETAAELRRQGLDTAGLDAQITRLADSRERAVAAQVASLRRTAEELRRQGVDTRALQAQIEHLAGQAPAAPGEPAASGGPRVLPAQAFVRGEGGGAVWAEAPPARPASGEPLVAAAAPARQQSHAPAPLPDEAELETAAKAAPAEPAAAPADMPGRALPSPSHAYALAQAARAPAEPSPLAPTGIEIIDEDKPPASESERLASAAGLAPAAAGAAQRFLTTAPMAPPALPTPPEPAARTAPTEPPPSPPAPAERLEPKPLYPEYDQASFAQRLTRSPYSAEVKALIALIVKHAPARERRIAAGLVSALEPRVELDARAAGPEAHYALERAGSGSGPWRIALHDGPALVAQERWVREDRGTLLPDGPEYYARNGLSEPKLSALDREAKPAGEAQTDWGKELRFADGSRRARRSQAQLAGQLLHALMSLDARLTGWGTAPYYSRLRSDAAEFRFYQELEQATGKPPPLDRARAADYEEWRMRPEDYLDLMTQTLLPAGFLQEVPALRESGAVPETALREAALKAAPGQGAARTPYAGSDAHTAWLELEHEAREGR